MNNDFLKQVARKNWHFLLVIAFILGAVGFKLLSGDADASAVAVNASQVLATRAERAAARTSPRDIVAEEREKAREVTMTKIRENEAALATNPDPEKAAAYVNGIGNMYFQRLQDYAAAASHYERVLSDYPDAPAKYQTYIQLALCYERLNDEDKRKSTLRRMMESYPQDSQHYAYAYSELYGEMPPQVSQPELQDSEIETQESSAVEELGGEVAVAMTR